MTAEVREERRLGARERVHGLVAVADDAEIRAVAEPRAQQTELRGRRVLELVDVEVAEAPALCSRELGIVLERVGAPGDEVVEVDEPATALLAFVRPVDLGDLIRRAGEIAPGRGGRAGEPVGRDEACLRPLDLARHFGGGEAGLPSSRGTAEEWDEDAHLALEQRGHRATGVVDPPPQLRERDGMERAGGDRVLHVEPAQARAQLARRLAGERDGEHVPGIDCALARLERDPAREHARLARARAGKDRERRGSARDRLALGRVETAEQLAHRVHRRPGVRHRTPLPGQGARTRKAPSSLRCVAARISSGPFLRARSTRRRFACGPTSAPVVGIRGCLRRDLRTVRFPGCSEIRCRS